VSVDNFWSPPADGPAGQSYRNADGELWEPRKEKPTAGVPLDPNQPKPGPGWPSSPSPKPDDDIVIGQGPTGDIYGGQRKIGKDNRPTPKKPRHIV